MTLTAQSRSPIAGQQEKRRVFQGIPMLSKKDHMVYLAMTDQLDSFAFLTFSYAQFNFAPMFYRSGLLVSGAPETKYPLVQRVSIVARDLSEEELPYILGLLKTDGKQILLSQKQYALFLEKFRDYPWMGDFLENYLPLFQLHRRSFYCFDEDEILSCSKSELPYPDRLRIMLALKSVDPPNDNTLHKFLRASVPPKTHTILK